MRMTKQEKRRAKTAGRTIKSYNALLAYAHYFFHPSVLPPLIHFAWIVLKDFFLLQFDRVIGFTKTKILHVDNPLDEKIPFDTTKVEVYLDFINYWVRPFVLLTDRIGTYRTARLLGKWLKLIAIEYHEASRMYRFRMSTTKRPEYTQGMFSVLHALDPHLLCVPSLHVAILSLFYAYFRDILKDKTFTDKERFNWTTEVYNHAIEIAESVLYVKQHSINCVAAALYMVSRLWPDTFTPTDATNFINDMFLSATDISQKDCAEIREYIAFNYECFLLEGCISSDWRDPIKKWLVNYSAE